MSEPVVFYVRRGRRYVPVREYDQQFQDAMPYGAHLTVVRPGNQSTRYSIDPALAPMIAAGTYAEDAVCRALHRAGEVRPKIQPITDEQRQAWDRIKQIMDDDAFYLQYASVADVARAGVEAMAQEAQVLLDQHPAVRDAYEQFMNVVRLTTEQKGKTDR
jgi:hypothetical protein